MLKKEGLASISEKLNPFWRDILLNLPEQLTIKDEQEKDISSIWGQLKPHLWGIVWVIVWGIVTGYDVTGSRERKPEMKEE
jgi:hypothetical protein